jgi:tetratricopeptide (TPR) repeat protein
LVRAPSFNFALMAIAVAPTQPPQWLAARQEVGTVRFATSCSAAAQPTFNRAVALLHSFAFSAANENFHAVLRADPRCGMAWWGLALDAWGNPFAAGIKPAAQIQRGLDAVTRARSTGAPTPRETRYIDAAARLYEHADAVDQRTRLLAYRDMMAQLVAAEPADTEAAIFHALAVVVSADPADKTYASQLAAGATLERLFAVLPDHPGLAHYIIHSYDVPALASRAVDAAQRYSRIAPAIAHALHMPSHTYTRIGHWQQSIDANIASVRAARREGSVAEELHASDYLVYAYLQLGQGRAAERILAALPAIAKSLDPNAIGAAAPPAAGYFAIAAIPARIALEQGAWPEAVRLELRPSPVPFADAMTWFARALGAAHTGDTAAAEAAVAALSGIRDRLAQASERYWSEQVEIQRRGAAAWLAFSAGRKDEGLAAMRAAADREDATEKNAITPGPLAPARELLGEMLLAAGEPTQALTAFETVLRHEPNRFRALAGAGKSARAAGDTAAAGRYDAELRKLGAGSGRRLADGNR